MSPNNNFSVLPWYTSIEQQNARKWWAYGRVYPLFSPSDSLLPFQIMREAMRQDMPDADTFNGYIRADGGMPEGGENVIRAYDVQGLSVVYLADVPVPVAVAGVQTVSAIAFDADRNVLETYTADGTETLHKWTLPAGAVSIYVQVKNAAISEEYGYVFNDDSEPAQVYEISIYDYNTGARVYYSAGADELISAIEIKPIGDIDVIVFPGASIAALANGRYYAVLKDQRNTWYSEVFTAVQDMAAYLKIMWWDDADFLMDAGAIVYQMPGGGQFKNVLYLKADIAKPEYIFEEEGESRDGYFFPVKQISEKRYRFAFLASEYLLDVMRFIRMADYVEIEKNGQTYKPDTFLITPTWEDDGDVASVEAEFETDTVAKKVGFSFVTNN